MNTKHTYAIKTFGNDKATNFNIEVNWPDSLAEFCAKVPGGEQRVYAMLCGFVAAHHVQSKVKSAFGAENPTNEQTSLRQDVEDEVILNGVDFVPAERGQGDEVIKKLRQAAADGKLTGDKYVELWARWTGSAENCGTTVDELVGVYLDWKRAQSALKDLGL